MSIDNTAYLKRCIENRQEKPVTQLIRHIQHLDLYGTHKDEDRMDGLHIILKTAANLCFPQSEWLWPCFRLRRDDLRFSPASSTEVLELDLGVHYLLRTIGANGMVQGYNQLCHDRVLGIRGRILAKHSRSDQKEPKAAQILLLRMGHSSCRGG